MTSKKPKKQALWMAAAAEAGKPPQRTLREIHEAMKPEATAPGVAPHPWRRSGGGLWPKRGKTLVEVFAREAAQQKRKAEAVAKRKAKLLADYYAPAAVAERRLRQYAKRDEIRRLQHAANQMAGFAAAMGAKPFDRSTVFAEVDASSKRMSVMTREQRQALQPKRKPVRRVSKKKAKSDRLYNAMVREWLALPENQMCRVMRTLGEQWAAATQCHHKCGRLGPLKFDTRFWVPVSAAGHAWIDANRAKAVVIGLLGGPGEWHVAPDDAETKRIRDWMVEKGLV